MIDAEALMFAGITPPAMGSHRTTCPKCQHKRTTPRKSKEKCLVVYVRDWGMEVKCHHCKWEDGIV